MIAVAWTIRHIVTWFTHAVPGHLISNTGGIRVGIGVGIGVTVCVSISVTIAVAVAVTIAVAISIAVAVTIAVTIAVAVAVTIAVHVAVCIRVCGRSVNTRRRSRPGNELVGADVDGTTQALGAGRLVDAEQAGAALMERHEERQRLLLHKVHASTTFNDDILSFYVEFSLNADHERTEGSIGVDETERCRQSGAARIRFGRLAGLAIGIGHIDGDRSDLARNGQVCIDNDNDLRSRSGAGRERRDDAEPDEYDDIWFHDVMRFSL
jgi:hypothetical protein